MPVSLLDLTRQHEPLRAAFSEAFERVIDSNHFVLGPEVSALEEAIAAYCDCRYAIGMSSGTDALLVALMALGVGPGDEVLCPAFTFFGTAGSVVRLGATPVWVDVLPDTYNMDLADAAGKVSPRTKVIIPVHLFGQPAEMDCVCAFAQRHGLRVLEDVAQAIGATYRGRKAGSFGDFGALSFYPTKNLGGFGDGGMLVTDDADLAQRAIRLRNHGMEPRYFHREVGGNFRLDGLQAALLRVKLPHLDAYHAARRAHAEHYLRELEGHSGVIRPLVIADAVPVWNQFTLRIPHGQRDGFRQHLAQHGIGSEIYYPLGLQRQECFAGLGRGGEHLPVTDLLCAEVVSIPVFPELSAAERAEVLEVIWRFGYPG